MCDGDGTAFCDLPLEIRDYTCPTSDNVSEADCDKPGAVLFCFALDQFLCYTFGCPVNARWVYGFIR